MDPYGSKIRNLASGWKEECPPGQVFTKSGQPGVWELETPRCQHVVPNPANSWNNNGPPKPGSVEESRQRGRGNHRVGQKASGRFGAQWVRGR